MTGLGLLDAMAPGNWPTFVLVSARMAGLAVMAPLWSLQAVPRTVRGAFAIALTVGLLHTVPSLQGDLAMPLLPVLLAAELFVGLAIGLTAALMLHAVQIAAEVVSTQMGLSIAGTLAPTMSGTTPGMGELTTMLALGIYAALGGHLMLLQGLGASLQSIPPGTPIAWQAGIGGVLGFAGEIFGAAIRVAAPVLVALLLTHVALAILGKAVPQLNVLMLAFPITIGVGLVAFGAALPFIGMLLGGWVEGLPHGIRQLLDTFGGGTGR